MGFIGLYAAFSVRVHGAVASGFFSPVCSSSGPQIDENLLAAGFNEFSANTMWLFRNILGGQSEARYQLYMRMYSQKDRLGILRTRC